MAENLIEVKCVHCGTWFKAPFDFDDLESFTNAELSGHKVNCPRCNSFTPCDKEYLRFIDDTGKVLFVGAKTV